MRSSTYISDVYDAENGMARPDTSAETRAKRKAVTAHGRTDVANMITAEIVPPRSPTTIETMMLIRSILPRTRQNAPLGEGP